jgi:neopullulanase
MKKILFALMLALFPLVASAQSYRSRLPEDEVIYFLLPDRFENGDTSNDTGGMAGDRLKTGYDRTQRGFYHGGDLQGVTQRLGYLQDMGVTAIWLAPIFKNKPVQGAPGNESAGYHGYWVTDFTTVDPHFGTDADFKAFVDAAHARGMKVYMDIITNHTADVISYKECEGKPCPYRSRADYPYSRRASDGKAINSGFLGDSVVSTQNFGRLTDPNFAYTITVPSEEARIKKPDWMNNPIYYHNRGNSTFTGENSTMGDFVGLDDLMTEHPRVVQGFIDIYKGWIDRFGVDGFRIDTAKHVNNEFWQVFAPAIMAHAKMRRLPNFHMFGEVYSGEFDPVLTAQSTRATGMPTVIDFAFHNVLREVVAGGKATDKLAQLYASDILYEGGEATAQRLPTFTGNHDAGRFARFAREGSPEADDAEILKRTELAHAMMFLLRGVPVVYAGDEQGFAGDGNDMDAREDMFPSKVAAYNDNKLVGTAATTADSNFDPQHPLYRAFTQLAGLRTRYAALRRGKQTVRTYSEKPGVFAVSRIDPATSQEILIVFNTARTALQSNVDIDYRARAFTSLRGACPMLSTVPGQLAVSLPPLDYMVCLVK